MSFHWHDPIGLVGVALVLGAQAFLQLGRLRATQPLYPALNALGAGLILISLLFDFNLSAVVIEGAWLIISLIGWIKGSARQPKRPEGSARLSK